jgi:hypothetical protein
MDESEGATKMEQSVRIRRWYAPFILAAFRLFRLIHSTRGKRSIVPLPNQEETK